jgi:G3E family GTPase
MSYAFEPLLAQFIRRTRPDRLIVEPSGASHPSKITDVLRGSNFASAIDLRNTICLVDPKDFEDTRWRNTEVFHDQIQLADIVVINWTDKREKDLIHRCRDWIESFDPPKQFVFETSFGQIDPEWLDIESPRVRFPSFPNAHPKPISSGPSRLNVLTSNEEGMTELKQDASTSVRPTPGSPIRFLNNELGHDACGWVFHVDDIFRREQLLELLGHLHPIVRLKGIFRCQDNWWSINRAKDTTSYVQSSYRRDSRLEIILDRHTGGWDEFERKLLACLASNV